MLLDRAASWETVGNISPWRELSTESRHQNLILSYKQCFAAVTLQGLLSGYLEVSTRPMVAIYGDFWKQGACVSMQIEGSREHEPAGSGD